MVAPLQLSRILPKNNVPMIIDTHTHVGEGCLLARNVGAIERGYPVLSVNSLIQEMDAHGVSKAVLVQWGNSFDHHYLDYCLNAFPKRFAAVCEVDSRREDACKLLRCLAEKHHFRGVRLSTTDRSPGSDEFAIWKTAADLGIVVSASARSSQEFATGMVDVLRKNPNLTVRLEHLGRPPHDDPSQLPAFENVLRFANYPQVFINLDGFYSHHYPHHLRLTAYPFPEYQEFVRQAVNAFGPERCMWGSEFPFMDNGYGVGLKFLQQACDFLSSADREWILGKTGAALWKL